MVLRLCLLFLIISEVLSYPSRSSTLQQVKTSIANVYDFGAKGDGVSDDTTAFQNALNSFQGKGGVVYVPSGTYLFRGHINVPKGVSMEGTYRCVPAHSVVANDMPTDGTIFLPYEGRNNGNGPSFITVNEDATVQGFVIYYKEQVPTQAPVPYPWSIDLVGQNAAVMDVECLNCWDAIRAVGAARHYIARVQGQPINTGIYVDQTYDIGRIEDVHWNPWYSSNKQFVRWQLVNGRAFVFARTDWEYVFNCFAFGYAIGYHFVQSSTGSCNGNFLGIGADMVANASVKVDSADAWGILITNGEFTSFVDPNWGEEYASPCQVLVSKSNTGAVRFENTAFWGPSDNIARIDSGSVSFSNCVFNQWNAHNKGDYAILVTGGSIQLIGNDFQFNGNQVSLASSVQRAVVTGNLIQGTTRIANSIGARAQIGLNAPTA